MVAGAITIPTAVPYVGYAAIGAAVLNIQNIACIDHTKQYFVCKSIQLWLYISAIIVLVCVYGVGVVDGSDGYWDIGIDHRDVWGYAIDGGDDDDADVWMMSDAMMVTWVAGDMR